MDFNISDKERAKAIRHCRMCLDGIWKDIADPYILVARLRYDTTKPLIHNYIHNLDGLYV